MCLCTHRDHKETEKQLEDAQAYLKELQVGAGSHVLVLPLTQRGSRGSTMSCAECEASIAVVYTAGSVSLSVCVPLHRTTQRCLNSPGRKYQN